MLAKSMLTIYAVVEKPRIIMKKANIIKSISILSDHIYEQVISEDFITSLKRVSTDAFKDAMQSFHQECYAHLSNADQVSKSMVLGLNFFSIFKDMQSSESKGERKKSMFYIENSIFFLKQAHKHTHFTGSLSAADRARCLLLLIKQSTFSEDLPGYHEELLKEEMRTSLSQPDQVYFLFHVSSASFRRNNVAQALECLTAGHQALTQMIESGEAEEYLGTEELLRTSGYLFSEAKSRGHSLTNKKIKLEA
jgi:hypothetical protein